MKKYSPINYSPKQQSIPIASERISRENVIFKSTPSVKLNFGDRETDGGGVKLKENGVGSRSQRYGQKQRQGDNRSGKLPFAKGKILRSYSQTKNNLSKPLEKEQFLIRIPKNQNLIENYIQQLKELKKKIADERVGLDQFHKLRSQRRLHQKSSLLKVPGEQKNGQKTTVMKVRSKIDDFQSCRKTEQLVKNEQKIVSRDMKKHMKRLKFFKDFIDQNQQQRQQPYQQHMITPPYHHQPAGSPTTHPAHFPSLRLASPTTTIHITNLKQQFRISNLPQSKKFNRYSSQSGRKLYSISKSVGFRRKERNYTEERVEGSKSVAMKRRKTEEGVGREVPLKVVLAKGKQANNQIVQNSTTAASTSRPAQTPTLQKTHPNLPPQPKQPFKSIEGFSTIEANKQTLDILGESCLQIKNNLMQSKKKMDHILDLLGYNTGQLKENCGLKEKKRKVSYERFSKAFPKGFFK